MEDEKILKEIGEVSIALAGFKTDLGEKVSKSDLNAVTKAVEEVTKNVGKIEAEKLSESMGAIKKQIEEMTEKVNQLRDKSNGREAVKTIDQLVHEKADAFKAIANGGGKETGFKFKVKADQNVDKTVVYSSSVTSSTLSYREPAIGQLAASERLIAEGAAAVGVAGVVNGRVPLAGRRTAIVLTGANIDVDKLRQLI